VILNVAITDRGVKLIDREKKRVLWMSRKSFGDMLSGGVKFDLYPIPRNTYAIKSISGDYKVMWVALIETERKRKITRTADRGSSSASRKESEYFSSEIITPNSIWFVKLQGDVVAKGFVYTIKAYPGENRNDFQLYKHPFPNVYQNGGICFGRGTVNRWSTASIPEKFYEMPFTPELVDRSIKGYENTWEFIKEAHKLTKFPYDKLSPFRTFHDLWNSLERGGDI
jgi:hypothetical protein